MRNSKVQVRRLVMRKETVRSLRAPELEGVVAGWECSGKTSGNILCNALVSGSPDVCETANRDDCDTTRLVPVRKV